MISCQVKHLAARCRERGYTLDEVRPCIVSQDGDKITVDETHPAYPRTAKPGLTLPQKVANFATSAAKHLAAGMPRATEEQVAERFVICQACEHFDGKACRKCGCPIVREKQYISKLSWAKESCPVGKWGPAST
jgi:hypothetical protein